MLVRAFADDPFSALLAPEPAQRPAAARWAFTAFARYGLAFGEVQTVDDLTGVAIWWAPDYVQPTAGHAAQAGLAAGQDVLGPTAWARFEVFGALTDELHHRSVAGPHWYLNVLGVAPEAQGLGSAAPCSPRCALALTASGSPPISTPAPPRTWRTTSGVVSS